MKELTNIELAALRVAIQDKIEYCEENYKLSNDIHYFNRLKELKSCYKKLKL